MERGVVEYKILRHLGRCLTDLGLIGVAQSRYNLVPEEGRMKTDQVVSAQLAN